MLWNLVKKGVLRIEFEDEASSYRFLDLSRTFAFHSFSLYSSALGFSSIHRVLLPLQTHPALGVVEALSILGDAILHNSKRRGITAYFLWSWKFQDPAGLTEEGASLDYVSRKENRKNSSKAAPHK